MSASIILSGLGSHVPAKRLTNDDLSHLVETSDEWIRTRSGIRERRIAGPDENPSDLAVPAALKAIAQAGLQAGRRGLAHRRHDDARFGVPLDRLPAATQAGASGGAGF